MVQGSVPDPWRFDTDSDPQIRTVPLTNGCGSGSVPKSSVTLRLHKKLYKYESGPACGSGTLDLKAVFQIRDVLIRIRSRIQVRVSVPVPQDNGSAYLSFLLISYCRYIHIGLLRKRGTKKFQDGRNKDFLLLDGRIREAIKTYGTNPTDPEHWFKVTLKFLEHIFKFIIVVCTAKVILYQNVESFWRSIQLVGNLCAFLVFSITMFLYQCTLKIL